MAYVSIDTTEIQVDKPITNALMTKIKDNEDFLYGQNVGVGANVPNPSFEVDSDSDGTPDSWTVTLFTGGAGGFDSTDTYHGAQSYYFTHPGGEGNGGGKLESDYLECSTGQPVKVGWFQIQNVSSCKSGGWVAWYDKGKNFISYTTLVHSSWNSTQGKKQSFTVTPPTSARYLKVDLRGGTTDSTVAGTVRFDNVVVKEAGFSDLPGTTVGGQTAFAWTGTLTTVTGNALRIKIERSGSIRTYLVTQSQNQDVALSHWDRFQIIQQRGISSVAVGTLRQYSMGTAATGGGAYTEDLSGWLAGDYLNLYHEPDSSVVSTVSLTIMIDNVQGYSTVA